jgi:NDP-sugar pyrophosphorylase family protein
MNYQGLILAGGRGSRMGAMCDTTPKPLLKVKGRSLLEWILMRYLAAGFKQVHIAVRYLGAKITDRFGKSYDGMSLNYIVERDALGTAGCITLLPEPAALLVSNGDLYCSLDWQKLLDYHGKGGFDATVCAYPWIVPCGVLADGGDVITERPTLMCNAGMYVLEPHIVKATMMSSAHRQDMPDLINRAKLLGSKVGTYALKAGEWIDCGTPADLERANA